MKKISLSLFLISVLFTSSNAIEIKNNSDAINIAGKQRMFTQKMLKDYAMVGMNNKFNNPSEKLKETVVSFEDALSSLKKATKNKEIISSLKEVETIWKPIKIVLEKEPKKENAKKLSEDLDKLLKASNKTTQLFTKESKTKSGDIINISGRQRMLSQKMAGLYMLKVWEVGDDEFKNKLTDTMKLFKNSSIKLNKYSGNSEEINVLLKKVNRNFVFFEMMNRSTSKKFIPTLIYKRSNDILKDMNSVTKLYVKNKGGK